MSRMRTLTKKQKAIIISVVAVVVVVITIGIVLLCVPSKDDNTKNENITPTTTTAVAIQTPTEQPGTGDVTSQQWQISPYLYMYCKTETGFKQISLTEHIAESVITAKTFSPVVERSMDGERQYIEPEVRLYGVPLGAFVSVTCESMVTKAEYLRIGQNDGAYEYYYWQPRLYSASEQGEYTFKLTIKENEGSTDETVYYYKISV